MHSSPPALNISHVVVGSQNGNTIRIPITLRVKGKDTELSALIDSGAEGLFINSNLMTKLDLDQYPLQRPVTPKNVDGSNNIAGLITSYVWQPVKIAE